MVSEPLCVLVGSGVSLCAGMPSVDKLTHRIEHETEVYRHGQGDYHLGGSTSSGSVKNQHRLCAARNLFRTLRLHVKDYFQIQMGRAPNYEDVYYINEQIHSELSRDTENPLVMDWLSDRLLAGRLPPLSADRHDNIYVVEECRNLIRDVVWKSLKKKPARIDYLDNLFSPLRAATSLHVFSLNHDCVLDTYFNQRGILYADGFSRATEGVRYWDPAAFNVACYTTFLYKLHGSIDWFYLRPENGALEVERVGIPLDGDFRHTCAPDGRRQYPVNPRPVFLAGTFNKMTDYADDVFIELHHRFMSRLRGSRFLIVCGYSFGDKGINGRVLSWLLGCPDRRMIVIHEKPSQVRDGARGAVRREWDNLCSLDRIQVVENWIQDLDPEALAGLIC